MADRADTLSLTTAVAARFAACAGAYEQEALPQRQSASDFAGLLKTWEIRQGPILEIGSGIGFLTEHLIPLGLPLEVTDLSPEAVARCRERCGSHGHVNYGVLDGENLPVNSRYHSIVSGWTFQWFTDLANTVRTLRGHLVPGGMLCFSVPTAESFLQWRMACARANVRFTGHPLPTLESLKSLATAVEVRTYPVPAATPAEFFSHLKRIGASCSRGQVPLNAEEWKLLLNHWPIDNMPEQYTVCYVCVRV